MNKKVIFSIDTLYKIVHDLKAQGKRIALTHGAFDLFHHAHLEMLQKSSLVCDYLIVGIDSNNNVSQYKSYKRPIIDEIERMGIVNQLDCVDAVFLNTTNLDIDSYAQLYTDLMVDIVTVGRNFGFSDAIMHQTRKASAKLIRFDTPLAYTTSRILEKIIESYTQEQNEKSPDAYRPLKREW